MTRSKTNTANAAPRTAQTAAKHPARAKRGIPAHEATAPAEAGTLERSDRSCEAQHGSAEPAPPPSADVPAPTPATKLARLIALLRQPDGATIEAMGQATGWQAHSVRGAMAGTLKRKGLVVVSTKPEGGARRYRIGDDA